MASAYTFQLVGPIPLVKEIPLIKRLILSLSIVVGVAGLEATSVNPASGLLATEASLPRDTRTESLAPLQARPKVVNESTEATRLILTGSYSFGERSEAVKSLQRLVGAYVDGLYGWETFGLHRTKLIQLGLPTTTLPKVPAVKKTSSGPRYPSDKKLRCPKFEAKLEEYGLPVDVFSYIAYRESRCNPKAVNAIWDKNGKIKWTLNKDGSFDSGLLQINSSWIRTVRQVCKVDTGSWTKDLQILLDLDCNLKMARWIMKNTSGKLQNWRIYGGN